MKHEHVDFEKNQKSVVGQQNFKKKFTN